jgi:hypothetical protein
MIGIARGDLALISRNQAKEKLVKKGKIDSNYLQFVEKNAYR